MLSKIDLQLFKVSLQVISSELHSLPAVAPIPERERESFKNCLAYGRKCMYHPKTLQGAYPKNEDV